MSIVIVGGHDRMHAVIRKFAESMAANVRFSLNFPLTSRIRSVHRIW